MDTIFLHFDTNTREANILAEELQVFLERNIQHSFEVLKKKENSQDAGSILAIVLGAKSISEIGKGIAKWLEKRNEVEIYFENDKGKLIGKNLSSGNVVDFLKGIENLHK